MEWVFRGSHAVLAGLFIYMSRWLYLKGIRCDTLGERYVLASLMHSNAVEQLSAERYGDSEAMEVLTREYEGYKTRLKVLDARQTAISLRKPFKWV